jgi:TPR repeat protein
MQRFVFLLLATFAAPALAQDLERGSPPCDAQKQEQARDGTERGDPASIYLLARYLSTGQCMPGDGRKAIQLYGQAAALGYPPAFYNSGMLAAARRDFAAAERYFMRGAEAGHRRSELQLGVLYSTAPPPVGNDATALAWLSLTASRQESVAAEALDRANSLRARMSDEDRKVAEATTERLKERFLALPPFTP